MVRQLDLKEGAKGWINISTGDRQRDRSDRNKLERYTYTDR